MTWWVLTYLHNTRRPNSLHVLAATPERCHMFIRWWPVMPRRHMIYRNIRGSTKYCGWKYFWAESHCHEQKQSGNTYEHLFGPIPLDPHDHVWYYLFSMMTAPPMEHQGPLIHVPPPEIEMASARIFNNQDQLIPHNTITPVSFDSVMWDDYNFYNPAQPTRLTIPAGALYHVGCSLRFENAIDPGARVWIRLNEGLAIVMHSHPQSGLDWGGCAFSFNTDMRLQPADFLEVCVLHLGGGDREILAFDHFSPHFWIRLVGAYPI